MSNIRNQSAPVNGDATSTPQKFLFQRKVHRDLRLSAADLRVAYFIIDSYNPARGCAWPSQETLTAWTGLKLRNTKRAVARLVAFGVIIIKTRGRRGHATEYVPNWDYGASADTESLGVSTDTETGNRVSALVSYGVSADTHTVSGETPHPLSSRSESVGMIRADAGRSPADAGRARAGEAVSDAFEAWWAEYPRKEGRAAARKAFDAVLARGDVSVAVLVSKARQYATAKAHIADSKYIKQPANWLKEECWLEDPQPPRRKEPKPEPAPKANGKAEPPVGSLDETEPFEIFKDDDGWSDDPECVPEAIERGFSRDRCVRLKSNGRKGRVLGAVMGDDPPRVVDKCLWVTVCWKSTPMSMVSELDLEVENPTPEERVATAAAAEKRAKQLAEQVRRRDEVPKRFPIGARVQRRSDGRTGKVIKIDLDDLRLDVLWDDIRDRDCHLISKRNGSQISWMSDDEIERVSP